MACGQSRARAAISACKALEGDAETAGVAADLVQREKADIAVEERILEALCHHRPGELLEPPPEAADELRVGAAGTVGVDPPKQRIPDEVVHGAVRQHAPALRLLDRAFDQAQILGVGLALVEVGAVDRKASDDLDERPPERVHGEIAGVAVGIGDALQVRDQDLELAREARLEHLGLGAAQKPAVGALARR